MKLVFKQICRGKTTKFVESKSYFVWVCLLRRKKKEHCALTTVSQKFKICTLVFSLGGGCKPRLSTQYLVAYLDCEIRRKLANYSLLIEYSQGAPWALVALELDYITRER